jgi:hypothetical protein
MEQKRVPFPECDVEDHRDIMKRLVAQRAAEGEARYSEASRKRLQDIFEKKCKTSFIGALSQFEQFFGHLWGHGKSEDELTPNELAWRKTWNECRTAVLNNGNNQVRATHNEIQQYDVTWRRHERVLPVIPLGGKDESRKET